MTTNYDQEIPEYGDLMTVGEYLGCVESGGFIDYDGYGNPVKAHKMSKDIVIPSKKGKDIPKDATHIVWYNR